MPEPLSTALAAVAPRSVCTLGLFSILKTYFLCWWLWVTLFSLSDLLDLFDLLLLLVFACWCVCKLQMLSWTELAQIPFAPQPTALVIVAFCRSFCSRFLVCLVHTGEASLPAAPNVWVFIVDFLWFLVLLLLLFTLQVWVRKLLPRLFSGWWSEHNC